MQRISEESHKMLDKLSRWGYRTGHIFWGPTSEEGYTIGMMKNKKVDGRNKQHWLYGANKSLNGAIAAVFKQAEKERKVGNEL